MRAPTCEGPTSAPSATAAARPSPRAWRKVSRCTAIMEAVIAPRVRTTARSANARVRRVPVRGGEDSPGCAPGDLPPLATARAGHDEACSGSAYEDVDRGVGGAGTAPAELLDEPGAERPADRAGEAAPQGQGGDRAPGVLRRRGGPAWRTPRRRDPTPCRRPSRARPQVDGEAVGEREGREPGGEQDRAGDENRTAALGVDGAPDPGRDQPGREQADG